MSTNADPLLSALTIAAHDPPLLARFWAGVLQRDLADVVTLAPATAADITIRFVPTTAPKTGPNQMHLDLTSTSPADQLCIVARALELGGAHLDVGQLPDEGHVVLADPEGNEFCVIEPGNSFLAGTGVIGALASDGSEAVGRFWSSALGWPLVWDQDEETAIQSPLGGAKITWGGPPVREKTGPNRWALELAPPAGGDLGRTVERLVSLGATNDVGPLDQADHISMLDPDGNEFSVVPTS